MSGGVLVFSLLAGLFFLLSIIIAAVVFLFVKRKKLKERQLQVQKILYENPEIQGDFLPLEQGDDVISECLTCSMIKMGSSVSYSDDRCPQCGANTTKTYIG